MKVNSFKKLIKEAVAEAVREELHNILNESAKHQSIQENKLNFTSNDVLTVRTNIREKMGNMFGLEPVKIESNLNTPTIDTNSSNPYLSFIANAAANMTPQERSGLNNLG